VVLSNPAIRKRVCGLLSDIGKRFLILLGRSVGSHERLYRKRTERTQLLGDILRILSRSICAAEQVALPGSRPLCLYGFDRSLPVDCVLCRSFHQRMESLLENGIKSGFCRIFALFWSLYESPQSGVARYRQPEKRNQGVAEREE